jgi:hypothetical protein
VALLEAERHGLVRKKLANVLPTQVVGSGITEWRRRTAAMVRPSNDTDGRSLASVGGAGLDSRSEREATSRERCWAHLSARAAVPCGFGELLAITSVTQMKALHAAVATGGWSACMQKKTKLMTSATCNNY